MANFDEAIPVVLKHEGGYVNHPADPGGATNYGISLRWLRSIGDSDQDGRLDGDLDGDGDVDWRDIRQMKVADAVRFYFEHWWQPYKYGLILSQSLATKILDLSVNMGPGRAHRLLQRAINSLGVRIVAVDGKLGPVTLTAINQSSPSSLYKALCREAEAFYRSLNRPQFLAGWIKRAWA